MKSERLKKLEAELQDLQQWYNLGLVPKKDQPKHESEIKALQEKIEEEKRRLEFLKDNVDGEEYTIPKRSAQKQPFQDTHTIPDIDVDDDNLTDAGIDMESTSYTAEHTSASYELDDHIDERTNYEDDDEDPFSDKNRWKRGILEDPDSNDW